jgi:hypothetical protein
LRREYQLTGNESVFENMPKLYVPYPEINVVYAVLHDKWSQGRLPPSLQSSAPMGMDSRMFKALRRQPWPLAGALMVGGGLARLVG